MTSVGIIIKFKVKCTCGTVLVLQTVEDGAVVVRPCLGCSKAFNAVCDTVYRQGFEDGQGTHNVAQEDH